MDRIGEAFGRLDILVASAAATAFRPMLEQKAHNVRLTFAITVESFIALVQAAVPLMRGRPGRVVAISGIDSFQAMAGHGVLGSAKAAMESLVRAFALELGPEGITVNGVNPGFIGTDSSRLYVEQGLGSDYEAAVARLEAATPVRRARHRRGRGRLRGMDRLRRRGLSHGSDDRARRGAHDPVAARQARRTSLTRRRGHALAFGFAGALVLLAALCPAARGEGGAPVQPGRRDLFRQRESAPPPEAPASWVDA